MTTCPVCSGKGYTLGFIYSDFEPRTERIPCVCVKHRATFTGLWAVLLFVAGIALVAWCLP